VSALEQPTMDEAAITMTSHTTGAGPVLIA
jgi:hypothetical protein